MRTAFPLQGCTFLIRELNTGFTVRARPNKRRLGPRNRCTHTHRLRQDPPSSLFPLPNNAIYAAVTHQPSPTCGRRHLPASCGRRSSPHGVNRHGRRSITSASSEGAPARTARGRLERSHGAPSRSARRDASGFPQ